MDDDIEPELEVERLQSMHDTVEKLRSQLKTIHLASGAQPDDDSSDAAFTLHSTTEEHT